VYHSLSFFVYQAFSLIAAKRRVANQIPDEILNDPAIAAALTQVKTTFV
jgi:hypothetical protein